MKKGVLSVSFIGFIIIISSASAWFKKGDFFLQFLNTSFSISLILFIIGAGLFVFERGFFNGVIYGVKSLRKTTEKGKFVSKFDQLDDTNGISKDLPKKRSYIITFPLLLSGSLFIIIDTVLAYSLFS
ncbi:trehalose-6-phosphate synthase [Oikeobacillus pervagus]|uniref:Trehalose-6-phosphate synthase n=1 Tax=Oikeobacillus pervagus TaxID=1325931 RepID=A0AAJ1T2U8_9BACI|nr:DUF3899 domain-containing protein [Oikeobacillus pervagus]MDQ0215666.1 trehalose-6-phosphate synthase [Oikeobacillus pervagus]